MNEINFEMESIPEVAVETAPTASISPTERVDESVAVDWKRSAARYSLLFVDDDERFLDLCKKRFEGTDYVIFTADCAERALALMAAQSIDVLVTDMSMPGISGAELAQQVRSKYPDIIRIIVSGRFDFTDTLEAINTGHVDHYMTKPFNDKDLKLTIYRGLLQKERRDAEEQRLQKSRQNAVQRAQDLGVSVARTKQEVLYAYDQAIEILSELVCRESNEFREAAGLCVKIGQAIGEPEQFCNQLRVAALLQDISLVGSGLKAAERDKHVAHSSESADLVENLAPYQKSAEMIRSHHERFDGEGLPRQLKGEEIPLGARIISTVNAYLKLRTEAAVDHSGAIAAMLQAKDRYDPVILGALAEN